MNDTTTRRTFLASAGLAAVALRGADARADAPKAAPAPGVREDVAGLDDGHPVLAAYRKAVAEMKKRDARDPLGWAFQANMHGVPAGGGQHADWNGCMHGNWWFLPWHRGYLYFFERIVRKLSGDDTFRLPYWAWDRPGQNALPAPFRSAKYMGADNPLFDDTRKVANAGGPLRPRGSAGSFHDDWVDARGTSRFTTSLAARSFGGIRRPKTALPARPESTRSHGVMESRAHDLIHDAVGGDGGNMGDPRTATRDPIFWLHHANVDRLWNRWLDARGHENPADADWHDQQFAYYDESGTRVTLSVGDILARAAAASRYDDERRPRLVGALPAQQEKPVEPKVVGVASVQPVLKLGTTPFTKPLPFAADARPKVATALGAVPAADVEPPAVVLEVEGIRPPERPGVVYEVFVTRAGEKPSAKSYVGTISFFGRLEGHDHGHGGGGFTQGFDATDVLQRLRSANRNVLPDLEVSVVPHSTAGLTDADLAKQKVEVVISDITLKLVTEERK